MTAFAVRDPMHATRLEPAFSDLYAVCSCGARSLPFVARVDAERWQCPIAEGEDTASRAMRHWNARVIAERNDQVITAATDRFLRS